MEVMTCKTHHLCRLVSLAGLLTCWSLMHHSDSLAEEAAMHLGSYIACPRSPAAAFSRISTVNF